MLAISAQIAGIREENKDETFKNEVRGLLALGLVLIAFNVLAFAIPFVKNGLFWLTYVFTMIAILAQGYVFHTSFAKGGSPKSQFYGFPIARVGLIYLAAQLVLGFVGMACATFCPVWVGAIVYILLLVAAAVGILFTETVRDEIARQDVKLKADVSSMRAMQSLATHLVGQCEDEAIKAVVQSLADDLRYSDPVSSPAIADAERDLDACLKELQQAVVDGDSSAALTLCRRASAALAERNRLCKLNK